MLVVSHSKYGACIFGRDETTKYHGIESCFDYVHADISRKKIEHLELRHVDVRLVGQDNKIHECGTAACAMCGRGSRAASAQSSMR